MTPDMQELYVETQTRTNCNSLFSRQISLAKSQLREPKSQGALAHKQHKSQVDLFSSTQDLIYFT